MDAPSFRIWPPVALGVPLLAGYLITEWLGEPVALPDHLARVGGLALLWPSACALVLVPIGFALLWWGAVRPEEAYLTSKFGEEYAAYRARVRRWL